MKFAGILLPVLMAISTPIVTANIPPVPDLPDVVEKVLPGIVNISSTTVVVQNLFGMNQFLQNWGIPQERKQSSLGSGLIIDKEGYILTNNHVIENATEVMAILLNKKEYRCRVIGTDPKMDLALLQLRDQSGRVPADLVPVPLGDSDKVRIAEFVFAAGNPFGLQHTVTTGIISAKNRTIGQGPFDNFLQTDASINPGNSGGPLFNMKGEVIGINTAIFSRSGQSGGLGFAIPVNEAKIAVPDLKKYGRVPRPWMGILSERMVPQFAAHYGLPNIKGVLVYNLVSGAPAARNGIEPGDIVTKIDDLDVTEPFELERVILKKKPNDTAVVTFNRGGKVKELKLKLTELPRRVPDGVI